MHVLLVCMSLDPAFGTGTAEKAAGLARALMRAGERVTILTIDTFSAARSEDLRDARMVSLPLLNRRFWIPFPFFHRIREAVASADIVVLTNHWMLLNLAAASAARRLGKPTVVIPSGALPITGRSRLIKRLYNAAGGTRLIFEAAAHIATTREEAGNLTAYGVRADRIHVIPNAIELPAVTATGPSPYPTPFILFVGRLTATKGPDLLLEAFIRVAGRIPHHCVLAGPDEGMLPALRRTALRAGLAARVHIPGAISREEADRAFASSAIVVVPSRGDAMTLVVLEAAVHARPLIITDRCGVGSFAEAGAVRMTAADSTSIADALFEVLTSSDGGAEMGRTLRQYVAAHYTWDVIVEHYRRVFQEVAGRGFPRESHNDETASLT